MGHTRGGERRRHPRGRAGWSSGARRRRRGGERRPSGFTRRLWKGGDGRKWRAGEWWHWWGWERRTARRRVAARGNGEFCGVSWGLSGSLVRIFCILAIFQKKIPVWTLENFKCIFGPFTRRHSLWRRGNTARRHRLWRRGTAALAQPGRRGVDVAPSSAPQILAPSSVVLSTVFLQKNRINLSSSVGGA
jgi:hypothetical protein